MHSCGVVVLTDSEVVGLDVVEYEGVVVGDVVGVVDSEGGVVVRIGPVVETDGGGVVFGDVVVGGVDSVPVVVVSPGV